MKLYKNKEDEKRDIMLNTLNNPKELDLQYKEIPKIPWINADFLSANISIK